MVVYHEYSRRKFSGGRYLPARKKKLANVGSIPAHTKVGERKPRIRRRKGGELKLFLLSADTVNVFDPKTKKSKAAKISAVVENPANRHFIRRNIITKGAIVETNIGKVRITSRPGQENTINGVLVS